MAGTWPNMDVADMIARLRSHVSEPVETFFLDTEFIANLDNAAKEIAQEAFCLQTILPAVSTAYVREIAAPSVMVHFVEYLPEAGKGIFLERISPLDIGRRDLHGREPQYWYPLNFMVGIDPVPVAAHNFNFYVSGIPTAIDDAADQTELYAPWQPLMVLKGTARALAKQRMHGPAQLLRAIAAGEIEYLKQNVAENIPDGENMIRRNR